VIGQTDLMESDQADAAAQDRDQAGQGTTEDQQREQPQPPRWPLEPEENRFLVITFIGGVGAFIVGAGFVGGAIALARLVQRAKLPWWAWLLLAIFTVITGVMTGMQFHERRWQKTSDPDEIGGALTQLGSYVLIFTLAVLMWVGLAAGVK
jgi:hypothetical protein